MQAKYNINGPLHKHVSNSAPVSWCCIAFKHKQVNARLVCACACVCVCARARAWRAGYAETTPPATMVVHACIPANRFRQGISTPSRVSVQNARLQSCGTARTALAIGSACPRTCVVSFHVRVKQGILLKLVVVPVKPPPQQQCASTPSSAEPCAHHAGRWEIADGPGTRRRWQQDG